MVLPIHKQVVTHILNPDVIVFIITAFVSGLGNSVFFNFIYAFINEIMKKSQTEMTLVVITAMLMTALMFPWTLSVIKLVRGPIPALIISMFADFIRFLVMSLDVHFNVLVVIQILRAVSFALAFAAIMQHTNEISPESINMTMNGIVLTVNTPLSNLFVGFVGGKIFEVYGGRNLFLGVSFLCLGWAIIMIAYYGGKKLRELYFQHTERNHQSSVCSKDLGIDGPVGISVPNSSQLSQK